jgi:hypothetical protein
MRAAGKTRAFGAIAFAVLSFQLIFTPAARAQVGTWLISGKQRISCKPPLPPCRRRSAGRFVNTITLHPDGTFSVPRGFTCPATGLPAPDGTGTWTSDGNGLVTVSESGLVELFAECFDLQLALESELYEIRLVDSSHFRARIHGVATISRGDRVSRYKETERFKGILLPDTVAARGGDTLLPIVVGGGAGGLSLAE